jgi:hypothetical protein
MNPLSLSDASINQPVFKDHNIKYRSFGSTRKSKKNTMLTKVMSKFFSSLNGKKTKPKGSYKLPIETLKDDVTDSCEREDPLDNRGVWTGGPS